LSEIEQVCGEIKKTLIFVWNRRAATGVWFLYQGVKLPTSDC